MADNDRTSALHRKAGFLLLPSLAFIIAFLAYSQFFGVSILEFDAVAHILSHAKPGPGTIIEIFSQGHDRYLSTGYQYRPIQSIAWWAMLSLFGFDFAPMHMLNFLLHALNSVLVFFLAKKLLNDKKGFFALFASVLFALHPVHINTLLFVSRLPEPLAIFFLLASLLSFIAFLEKKRPFLFALSVLCCFLGVFSKEAGSMIPAILFFYALVFLKPDGISAHVKRCLRLCVPFFCTVLLYLLMMNISLGTVPRYIWELSGNRSQRLFAFTRMLFYPLDILKNDYFGSFYNFLNAQLADIFFIFYAALFTVVALLHFSKKAGDKALLFLSTWLFSCMFVLAAYNLLPSWYMYTPAVPFSIILALFLQRSLSNCKSLLAHRRQGPNAFRHGLFPIAKKPWPSNAVAVAITIFFLYLAFLSPLFTQYSQPWVASGITKNFFSQALASAQAIPPGNTIYLINCPEFLLVSDKGFTYEILLVNDASLQAFLDFALPEKNFEVVSLTAVRLYSAELSQDQFALAREGDCGFVLWNSSLLKAFSYIPKTWKQKTGEADLLRKDPLAVKISGGLPQAARIKIPQSLCANSAVFFFDGHGIQEVGLGG